MATRNPFQPKPVTSRRGGPAKAPLSQEAIVKSAFALLVEGGIEAMTLRKVATALETGAASLYAYVDGLEELEALVADHALAEVRTTWPKKDPWRKRLVALLESYGKVLMQTPGVAQLALRTIAIGPNALRVLDALLGILDEGGVDRPTAAWAADLFMLYVTAIAAEQTERKKRPAPLGHVTRALSLVTPEQYPHIHAAGAELTSGPGPTRFTWALDVLIAGVLGNPRKKG
jgi:AcrR family transcriptional regulator